MHTVPVGNPDFGQAFPCRCIRESERPKRKVRLLKWANLPEAGEPKTFANFEPKPGAETALNAAQNFGSLFFRDAAHQERFDNGEEFDLPHILVLTGRNGCGKSHLLEAIARAMLEDESVVRYEYVPELLDKLRAAYDDDAEIRFPELWARYERADVLLLDDLGAEKHSTWAVERLTALMEHRYRTGGILVVATNLDFDRMAEEMGYRIADRLFDETTGKVLNVGITANSYRTGRSWGQTKARS